MQAIIDGAIIESRQQLHDTLSEQLCFPAHYGRNLDALFDCLTDITEDTELHLLHQEELFAHLGVYADVLRGVLRDACGENSHLSLILEE